jgi:cytochrome bd-type quinol oxidase subunit 2
MATPQSSAPARGSATALAAVGSILAAGSCCLPVGTLLFAAGTAGASAFAETARVWLMPLSAVLLAVAFFQTYGRRNCCRTPFWAHAILWTSAALVLAMFLFPDWIAVLVADLTQP